MEKNVQAFIKFWSARKQNLIRDIAIKKRSLEQAEEKLSDPEFHIAKDTKRGAVKTKLILAGEEVKIKKPILRKNEDLEKLKNIPTQELPLPPAGVPVAKVEKVKEEKTSPGTLFG